MKKTKLHEESLKQFANGVIPLGRVFNHRTSLYWDSKQYAMQPWWNQNVDYYANITKGIIARFRDKWRVFPSAPREPNALPSRNVLILGDTASGQAHRIINLTRNTLKATGANMIYADMNSKTSVGRFTQLADASDTGDPTFVIIENCPLNNATCYFLSVMVKLPNVHIVIGISNIVYEIPKEVLNQFGLRIGFKGRFAKDISNNKDELIFGPSENKPEYKKYPELAHCSLFDNDNKLLTSKDFIPYELEPARATSKNPQDTDGRDPGHHGEPGDTSMINQSNQKD